MVTTRLLAGLVWSLAAARAADDPQLVLRRAIDDVRLTTNRIPNYTCVETVERNYYAPLANNLPRACRVILEQRLHPTPDLLLKFRATDRLRFDVAMVPKGEIFSWVGASRFEDRGIAQLVRSGPMGTGAFGSFLTVVFDQDVKQFIYQRTIEEDGRKFLEYAFDVPAGDSHYRVQVDDFWIHTPYSGTFQVDAATGTLARFAARTGELPEAAGSCLTSTALELAKVRIGTGEFLLTQKARQRFVAPDGREIENTTTFANCREYLGESTVRYETAEPGPANRVRAEEEVPRAFSSGLRFQLALDRPIDSTTAAAGDPFEARLVAPLRDSRQRLTAPASALVRGRILRMEAIHTNPGELVMVLRPEEVQVGNRAIAIRAMPDSSGKGKRIPIEMPEPGEDHAGVFRFAGDRVVVPLYFRSDWRTVP
jgi:hypothetical protein